MKKIINEIIPPNEYKYRNGFTNYEIIDSLDNNSKKEIEKDLLIILNKNKGEDLLIIETLARLKSKAALPILYDILEGENNYLNKIIISTCIFMINEDLNMVEESYQAFKKIDTDYNKITAFYYLSIFKIKKTDDIIKEYLTNKNYLLSYNAKQALTKKNS